MFEMFRSRGLSWSVLTVIKQRLSIAILARRPDFARKTVSEKLVRGLIENARPCVALPDGPKPKPLEPSFAVGGR
jgi:hypothetical protein